MAWYIALCVFIAPVIWSDFTQRKIKNKDVVALIIVGLALIFLNGSGFEDKKSSYFGASILAFGCLLPFYALGWMGAGDVKLAGALGLWLGMELVLEAWLLSVLLSIAAGIFYYYRQYGMLVLWERGGNGLARRKKFIPYGALMAISALAVGLEKVI